MQRKYAKCLLDDDSINEIAECVMRESESSAKLYVVLRVSDVFARAGYLYGHRQMCNARACVVVLSAFRCPRSWFAA